MCDDSRLFVALCDRRAQDAPGGAEERAKYAERSGRCAGRRNGASSPADPAAYLEWALITVIHKRIHLCFYFISVTVIA